MLSKLIGLGLLFFAIAACGNRESNSALSLTNARWATNEEFKSVVKLQNLMNRRFCAGTFIAEGVVVTVAHCVYGIKPGPVNSREPSMVIHSDQGIDGDLKAVAVYPHPGWSEGKAEYGYANPLDVAIVDFSGAKTVEISELANKPITPGVQATIVGFGLRQISGQREAVFGNAKQVGKNQIIRDSKGLFTMRGAGLSISTDGTADDSLPVFGDSGGPVFVDGQLAGLSALWKRPQDDSEVHESQIINLQSELVRGFIQKYL